jgi:bifunctional DNA-binding transcriptional regulator/antitoxin component of YhaV-PrlF toxin-antitoxin module
MTKVININGRGTLTLPKEFRERLGIQHQGQVVVEETSDGLLLRAGVTVPVEIYSAKRMAEFARNNDTALAGYRLKR